MLVFQILIKERECHALASRIVVFGRYHYLIMYLEPCFFLFAKIVKLYALLLRSRMHRETLIQGTALTGIVKDKFTM